MHTFIKMHFATMVHHATKARTKSVQFDKSVISLGTDDGVSSVDGSSTAPVPGTRTSSLPSGENKENVNTIRHYRSLLDVDDAPKLPITKPMSYEELYPKPTDTFVVVQKFPLRRPFYS